MTTQPPSEYLHNLEKRRNTRFIVYPCGRMIYLINGVEIEPAEFHRLFPLADRIRVLSDAQKKGYDLDKTHI